MEALNIRIQEIEQSMKDLAHKYAAVDHELRLFHALMDNIPDTIYFKDKESRFIWINKAQAEVLGLSDPANAQGKTDFDFFTEEHARDALADEQRILKTGLHVVDKVEQDNLSDGTPRWVSTTKIPNFDGDGKVIGTCGISRDVTERKRVEQALAHESSLLNALMENIPDAIYFKDTQSRFVKVSKFIHLKGINRPEDAIGKSDSDFFTPEHAQQAFADEQEIIRSRKSIIDKVEKETFSNGEETWVSTTKVPIYDLDGNVHGIVGISRDVTERILAQEALQKAKEELEIRVQERTQALVQEIKEHLRMEKALKESEKKLQVANQHLETRVNQLNFLNSTSHKLAHYTHRKQLLPAIVEAFGQCFPQVEVSLCEHFKNGFRCVAASERLMASGNSALCEKALSPYVQVELVSPFLVRSIGEDPHLGQFEWNDIADLPVYLLMPLQVEERSLAMVQIFAPQGFTAWFGQEQPVLNTLAAQAALSLSNANNFQELEKKARLEGELEVAQSIQKRFTPQERPSIPRVSLKGVYYPAYEVGGDYLDYFQTDSGSWVIVVADVSGKGIPAALVMTMLRSTFRAEARYENSAKNLLCAVNDLMIIDLDDKSFVTALCLIINKDGTSMSYARAGHPQLLFMPGDGQSSPSSMNPKGMALGLVDSGQFSSIMEEIIIPLTAGDRFLVFTDGLLEAMDPDRKTYGITRLLSLLASHEKNDPDGVLHQILEDVKAFTRSEPYHDDLTILAMQVMG